MMVANPHLVEYGDKPAKTLSCTVVSDRKVYWVDAAYSLVIEVIVA